MIPRSYLYVPGDAQDKLGKAHTRGADALIVDLEDAVPPEGKAAARAAVAAWLREQPPAIDHVMQIWVRVNAGAQRDEDIRAVAAPALTGVMLAKTESVDELVAVDAVLGEAEAGAALEPGSIVVVPLLESAAAVLRAPQIAAGPRVVRLQVGEADLAADTGITPGDDEREWAAIRSQTVLASAAAGVMAPVGPVSTNFTDLGLLRETTRALARQGFVGRACIHPAQVAVVNEAFTPDEAAVTASREIVHAYDAAVAAGKGVFVADDGRMIDEAVVRGARRLLGLVR